MAAHFTPAYFTFLRDLKKHNNRDWFAANRDRYIAEVEGPLLQFIGDFAAPLRAISAAYVADRRRMGGSMFRLHRDTRFSPDKSPFKTYTAARFAHKDRKKLDSVPAFYIHLDPEHSFGGGGMYHIEMPPLTRLRQRIAESPREWDAVRRSVDIRGEQLKRAPAGFPSTHEHVEDLKRKGFYTLTEFTEDEVTADGFIDRFTAACESAVPLVRFQTEALGLRW